MTRLRSSLARRDERRERVALLRVAERVAWISLGWCLGYLLGLLAP